MSLARLREICDRKGIQKIGFIDDIFDVPDPSQIDRGRYQTFVKAVLDEQVRRNLLGLAPEDEAPPVLPRFVDLADDDLQPYWDRFWTLTLKPSGDDQDKIALLRELFAEHGHDVLGMHDLVVRICGFFANELHRPVHRFNSQPDLKGVAEMDVVLVDFYLAQNQTVAEARREALTLIKNVRRTAAEAARRAPSFVLVSSKPEDVQHASFRQDAELLQSRFRFVPKTKLNQSSGTHLLDLHDVFEAFTEASQLESLIDDWSAAATAAVKSVRSKLLEFDVPDFVYLDTFRLYREGTSLGNYIRWLMTAYLQANVPNKLSRELWAAADDMRLFDVEKYHEGLRDNQLVKTFEGPGEAIGEAYGAILVDQTRGEANAFPGAIKVTDLLEGDMFLEPRSDSTNLNNARLLLVMTPTCDLVVRGGATRPAAGTVLFLPGTLTRFVGERAPREIGDVEFVRIAEPSEARPSHMSTFTISWHFKDVQSIPWNSIATDGGLSKHRRLGRLREPYFNHVREKFVAGVTRIGREVSPLFPASKAGEASVRIMQGGKAVYCPLFTFRVEDGIVWTFPADLDKPKPQSQTKAGSQGNETSNQAAAPDVALNVLPDSKPEKDQVKPVILYHATRTFVDRLIAAVRACAQLDDTEKEPVTALVESFDMAVALLQPNRSGPRSVLTEPKAFEFKAASSENFDRSRSSQSTFLILLREPSLPA